MNCHVHAHGSGPQKAVQIIGWVVLGLIGVTALAALLSLAVMALWNWLMPVIFGLPAITYWQALGLLVLSHLLFKSHGSHHHKEKSKKKKDKDAPPPTPVGTSHPTCAHPDPHTADPHHGRPDPHHGHPDPHHGHPDPHHGHPDPHHGHPTDDDSHHPHGPKGA